MFFSVSKRPSIGEVQALYREKKATPSMVVKFFLNRSRQTDKQIQSFYKYSEEIAEFKAKEQDAILNKYEEKYGANFWLEIVKKYPLFGIPYALKAIILAEGEVFNASSQIMDQFKAPYSSTVYEKIELAGGILLGIVNMDEWAMGASGENCYYAITKNPFDLTRVPGGSSSGPAACVASGQVVFSLGTDTGGSIRLPASFCDVVGLKPTYGLVSRFGVMPMASSFDQVGAFTNTVSDNVLITKILAGKDERDQTTIESQDLIKKLETWLESETVGRKTKKLVQTTKPLKIGIPEDLFAQGLDPEIAKALSNLRTDLESLGHELVTIDLPLSKYAIAVYYLTMSVEVASNLERIDGVRYALQQEKYEEMYFEHRAKFFGDEPKRRILLGTYASSAGYYDAYYNQAQKVRKLAKDDFLKAFEKCDLILTPTSAEFPFKIGQKSNDPLSMYLTDVFTCGINPVRIPGLSVPLGLFPCRDEDKTVMLPVGCQLLGPEKSENLLFTLAQEIEILKENNFKKS